MGTSGSPITIRLALGRSARPARPAGFPFGTTRTGSLRANTLGSAASFARTSACMCFSSAEANTSAGAPCSICLRSSCDPPRLNWTFVAGCPVSNSLPSSANASAKEAATTTFSSFEPSARALSATPRNSVAVRRASERMAGMSRRMDTESSTGDSLHVQLRHHLPRLPRVVPAQAGKLPAEGAPLQGLDDPSGAGVGAPLLGKDEVEPLLGEGNEVEAVRDGRAAGHDAHVRRAHGDGLRDLQVPGEKLLVAFDSGRGHAGLAQQPVEEPAGARPRLAVDEADLGPRDVLRLADPQRVSPGEGESLFEVREGHHHHRAASESAPDEGKVVLAGLLVEEVRAGEVRVPATEHLEGGVASDRDPAQPLPGPAILDVAGEDRQPRIAARDENVRL